MCTPEGHFLSNTGRVRGDGARRSSGPVAALPKLLGVFRLASLWTPPAALALGRLQDDVTCHDAVLQCVPDAVRRLCDAARACAGCSNSLRSLTLQVERPIGRWGDVG
jgi:hypothetical protein